VADSQPVRLIVKVVEVDTGQTIGLRSMFPQAGQDPFGSQSIPLRAREGQGIVTLPGTSTFGELAR